MVLYEDSPKDDLWFKVLLFFIPILFLVLGLLNFYRAEGEAREASTVLFAAAAFTLLPSWAISPRKYQVLEDRIRVVLGSPFSFNFNISFDTIREARRGRVGTWSKPRISFVTSLKNLVEILRNKGISVNISPSNRELFLEELNKAMANWKRSRGIT